jgi:alkanesulfonate monooxygenase SsuD/methylene tetrahydromethanopterin reductase-like flavin-dependent oxidoreductase (luciferase family)
VKPVKGIRIGVSLPQFTADPDAFVSGIERARRAGLDSVWVFDHLWPLSGGKERPVVEAWTALSYLAAASAEIEIGTLVTRSSLRHPALLAKMAATVGAIAPGRSIVAIGSGDLMSKPENDAFGIPYYGGPDRVSQLISAVRTVRAYLTGPAVTLHDDFVGLSDLPASPRPSPPPRVWVGGRGEDLLRFAGEAADGWNAWGGTAETFARDAGTVAEAAGDRAVELTWGGQVILGADEAAARRALGDRDPRRFLVGGPEEVAGRLRAIADAGARHLIVTFPNAADPEPYELLGGIVRPALVES